MVNQGMPDVSVVVPALNAEKYIVSALDCIQRQGVSPLEIIVVDDGSSDATALIAAQHPVGARIIRQQNGGPAAARNTGVQQAHGEIIAFLDVDDEWPDGTLAERLNAMNAHPGCQMVMGSVRFEGLDGTQIPLQPWAAPNLGAGLFRKEVFRLVGEFEAGLVLDDVDWFWRARDAGVVTVKLPQITLHYRRHGDSLTAAKTWLELGLGKVIRRALKRNESVRNDAPPAKLTEVTAPR